MEISIRYKEIELDFDLMDYAKYFSKEDFTDDVRAAFIEKLTEGLTEDLAEKIEEEVLEADEDDFIVTEEDLPYAFWFWDDKPNLTLLDLKSEVFDNLDFEDWEEDPFRFFLSIEDGEIDGAYDKFKESYCGEFNSEEEFARHYAEEHGLLGGSLSDYIDWEKYWDYELRYVFIFERGHVFYR